MVRDNNEGYAILGYTLANLSVGEEWVQRDSINYFPPDAYRPCSIQFFTDMDSRAMAWDKVELTDQRACLGRS